MQLTVRHGNPMDDVSSHKVVEFDPFNKVEVNAKRLGWIAQHLGYRPHLCKVGETFTDGMTDFTILKVSGDLFEVGTIYREGNTLPFEVIRKVQILWTKWYLVNMGYTGTELKIWKSHSALCNHLRGNILRFLP